MSDNGVERDCGVTITTLPIDSIVDPYLNRDRRDVDGLAESITRTCRICGRIGLQGHLDRSNRATPCGSGSNLPDDVMTTQSSPRSWDTSRTSTNSRRLMVLPFSGLSFDVRPPHVKLGPRWARSRGPKPHPCDRGPDCLGIRGHRGNQAWDDRHAAVGGRPAGGVGRAQKPPGRRSGQAWPHSAFLAWKLRLGAFWSSAWPQHDG